MSAVICAPVTMISPVGARSGASNLYSASVFCTKASSYFPDPKKDALGFGIFNIGHLDDRWEFFLLQIIQSRSALHASLTCPLHLHLKQKALFFFKLPWSVCCWGCWCWCKFFCAPCWLDSANSRPSGTGTLVDGAGHGLGLDEVTIFSFLRERERERERES